MPVVPLLQAAPRFDEVINYLVDGFQIAEVLKQESPEDYEVLSGSATRRSSPNPQKSSRLAVQG